MTACGADATNPVDDGQDAGTDATPAPTTTGTTPVTPPSTCTDAKKGGTETDVDCGGSCPKCAQGKACAAAGDCSSGVCNAKVCAAPSCTDTVKNGTETDADCGGSCSPCGDGKACTVAGDCATGLCDSTTKKCLPITCSDTIKNGTETDVDCGGTCSKCTDNKTCAAATDCASGVCDNTTKKCKAAACNDTVKNGTETDVDCGGTCATKCADNKTCAVGADCATGVCDNVTKKCKAAACSDAVKNGTETDVDCGGTCATKCIDTKKCAVAADCASGVCDGVALTCTAPACNDTVKNGSETDVDCGGAVCASKCAVGKACAASSDCNNGICEANACRLPKSCNERKTAVAGSTDGVYSIDPDGAGAGAAYDVYCDMTNDGGGWTLAIKADGAQTTFGYDQALWTDASTFGSAAFDATEAKLQSFSDLAFTNMRIALVTGGVTNTAVIPQVATSLKDLFSGPYVMTAVTRAGWKNLVPGSSLQANCNNEGFNSLTVADSNWSRVRIGILGNEQNDCTSPDSWIGIGAVGAPCNGGNLTSVGNVAGCGADNGDVVIQSFGYVFVR
jgi:hypothetical protein